MGPLFSQQKSLETLHEEKRIRSNLNPKFTFKNFVLGKNNNLAYAIASPYRKNPENFTIRYLYIPKSGLKNTSNSTVGNKIIETKPE
jgi:chromosomal replication initiation ATPase DnaA